MPLFARSRTAAALAALIAFGANYQLGFRMESHELRYTGFGTVMFPFAVGSLCCHYYRTLRLFAAPMLSVAAWCAFATYWLVDPYWPWTYGLALSVPLSAWVIISLAGTKGGHLERWAGDLSYPIYLFHTTVAAWFLPYFGYGRSFWFFAIVFAVTLIVSWALIVFFDRPLQRFKVKGRLSRKGATVVAIPSVAA